MGGDGRRRRDRKGGGAVGRVWQELTKACFIALIVLPEGHQPDGDGLQKWPDGRRELWRDAAGSPAAQEGLEAGVRGRDVVWGEAWSFSKHLVSSYSHCSRQQEANKGACSMSRNALKNQ